MITRQNCKTYNTHKTHNSIKTDDIFWAFRIYIPIFINIQ